jgi:hypothetical protein
MRAAGRAIPLPRGTRPNRHRHAGQHCRHQPDDIGTTPWAGQEYQRRIAEALRTPRLLRSPLAHRADKDSFHRDVEQEDVAAGTYSQYDREAMIGESPSSHSTNHQVVIDADNRNNCWARQSPAVCGIAGRRAWQVPLWRRPERNASGSLAAGALCRDTAEGG